MPFDAHSAVVFFTNGIGDRILNLPALRALADFFQEGMKLVTTTKRGDIIYSDLHGVTMVVVPTRMIDGCHRFDPLEVITQIPECDFFISLVPYFSADIRTLLETWKLKRSIGFFENFSEHLTLDFHKHSSDLAFDVPRFLNPNYELRQFSAPPKLPEAAWEMARRLLGHLPEGSRILALHGETLKEKMWVTERFQELSDALLPRHPDLYILVVGLHSPVLDRSRHGDRIIPLYGAPLAVSMAAVAQADFFLGVDSCMLHVADIFRVPGIGLFGPTDPAEFGFKFGPHLHFKRKTMFEISVEEVLEGIDLILASNLEQANSGAVR